MSTRAASDGEPGAGRTPAPPLLAELAGELRAYLRAVDAFDEAVSLRLGINRTDLRCLDLLEQNPSMTAGELARAGGLTSGAITFVLDRLEAAGLVARRRDSSDRRRVLISLTPAGRERGWRLHRPLVAEMRAAAGQFSKEELSTVCRFLHLSRQLYERHGARLGRSRPRRS